MPEEFKKIKDTINSDIAAAAEAARKAGKPLLIIVGENHCDQKSVVLGACIIKAAHANGIKTFADESDDKMLLATETKTISERNTTVDFNAPLAKKALGMKVIGVEKPDETIESGLTVEGIKRREDYMNKKLLDIGESTVFATGRNHLQAFANNYDLQNKYQILVINTDGTLSKNDLSTPLGKLGAEREKYAEQADNVKQYRVDDDLIKQNGMKSLLESAIGHDQFVVFDKAINQKHSPRKQEIIQEKALLGLQGVELMFRKKVREEALPRVEFSESELNEAAEISPKLVKDIKEWRNTAGEIVAAKAASLKELAEASKKQPEITELIRTDSATRAFISGALPLDKLTKLSAEQIKEMEEMGLEGASVESFSDKLSSFVNGQGPNSSHKNGNGR